jgi:hypothetical protein
LVPVLEEGADFVGVGDRVIVATIVGIMAIVQTQQIIVMVMVQVRNLDNSKTGFHLALVSSLGNKETDWEAITELRSVSCVMTMDIPPSSALNWLLIIYKLMPI